MEEYLQYFIENECFIMSSLLSSRRFISYCQKRTMEIDQSQLERFEKLGIFHPIARIAYPKVKHKIERIENSKQFRDFGILKDGDVWEGETREEYAQFWFEKEQAQSWFKHGFLWQPSKTSFQEWCSFVDDQGIPKIESFYSPFQCYTLYHIIQRTRHEFQAEQWVEFTAEEIQETIDKVSKWANQTIQGFQKNGVRWKNVPIICQIISNRYRPKTLSDRRSIRLTPTLPIYHDWDWYEFCRKWNAQGVLANSGIKLAELNTLKNIVVKDAKEVDPLQYWFDLVSFVSVDKKKKLKGRALLAQDFYAMGEMLRLFYEDITGEQTYPPNESLGWERDKFYGDGVTNDELQYLEFLTNEYRLNPRPKLILIVEGSGEKEQLPRLAKEYFGYPFSRLGIKILNLQGVANFVGAKRKNPYSALEKFIDYQHHHEQTFVFVVLDNEGGTGRVKEKLVHAKSIFYPKCFITKAEYIHLWDTNIEFDNFSDTEIAQAMTQFCQNRYTFASYEIAQCREMAADEKQKSKGKDYLSELFTTKTGYGSNKPELLSILFSYIIEQATEGSAIDENIERPIVQIMQKIIELSIKNRYPNTQNAWKMNQEAGFFGDFQQ